MTISRRDFLRASAVAGTAAVAGCAGVLGDEAAAAPADWLYEPGTVSDVDHYLSFRYEPAALAERRANFDDQVYDVLTSVGSDARDRVGLDFDEVDAQLLFGSNSVLAAAFDASRVASSLEADDFERTGTYEAFEVYVDPGVDVAVGIGEDALVVARSTGIFGSADDAEAILEAIVEVRVGDAQSYVEDSADFETLVDAMDAGALQSMRTHEETGSTDTDQGRFAGEVARGIDSELVDAGVETTFVRVFNEAADVDPGDVEDWVDRNRDGDGAFADFESVDVTVDGRVATVTGTEPTGAYDFYVEGV